MGTLELTSRWCRGFNFRRTVYPAVVCGTYIAVFAVSCWLTPDPHFLTEVTSWNLAAGLNLGLLLGYGLQYAPVVFVAHLLAAFLQKGETITAWHAVFAIFGMTGLYALATIAVHKIENHLDFDFADQRHLTAIALVAPVAAVAISGMLALAWALTGLITWSEISDTVLRGSLGHVSGFLLITPLVVLSREWFNSWSEGKSQGTFMSDTAATELENLLSWPLALIALPLVACFYFIIGSSVSDGFLLFCFISLPLLAVSLRFGLYGTSISLVVIGFIAVSKAQAGDWTNMMSELVIIAAGSNALGVGLLVSERHQQRTTMVRQAALLNSVKFATEQLLGMTDREKNVNEVLRQLAREAKVSRIYVLENRYDASNVDRPVVYECWASPNLREEGYGRLNAIRNKEIRRQASALAEDQALQFRTKDLPEDEQPVLFSLGIQVGIILPIFADGRWWGCLGLDQCSTDDLWPEPEVNALKATAHVLGALLAHANVEQQFRQFTGNIPAVFWIASPNALQKTYVSPAYEQIWGRPCESIYENPLSWVGAVYHKDYTRVRAAIDNKKGEEYDEEYRIVRPDREVRWIRDTAVPVRDASGQVSRVVGIAQDITAQKEAEERLRATSKLLSTLIDNLQVGILVENDFRHVMHVNEAFCNMFDVKLDPESRLGMDPRLILKQQPSHGKRMDQIIKNALPCRGEELATNDGRIFNRDYIPLSIDGTSNLHLWQYEDITERRRSEGQVRSSLKEKEVLLKEIHHRVKNNLQIISSLLNLQSMQIRDPHTAQVFRDSQSRVKAMALVHERLYQSADLARIDFSGYVQDVTNHLLRSYQTGPHGIRLRLDVDPVALNIDTAVPCALIINELVSNSLKYAFPNGRKGEIRIRLAQVDREHLNLLISDNGVGFPEAVSFETTESLGLQLVRSLVEQISGTVQYRNGSGTEFDITFRPIANERKSELVRG